MSSKASSGKVSNHASVIIPVKGFANVKSRLVGLLSPPQRRDLNMCMLNDVLGAVRKCERVSDVTIVSPDEEVLKVARALGTYALREAYENGVNAAVSVATAHCLRQGADLMLIVPSDVPLVVPEDLAQMIELARTSPTVVISPSSRFDGTNALVLRPPKVIRTFYDEDSFHSHLQAAEKAKARSLIYLSERVMLDIDTNQDINQFLARGRNSQTDGFLRKILVNRKVPTASS